mmetsp:Transcript_68177/g.154246  ORF Transcript_68177/g.154246 Transcript_68177/m.154246 type:complete len:278 (+) Transcript_68177:74-907(+)
MAELSHLEAAISPSLLQVHGGRFEVFVGKEDFKFNAAHFVCFDGYRERLHGHNYTVAVRLEGERVCRDGYVVDFGDVKKQVRAVCKSLNERFLCPCKADVMRIACEDGQVTLKCPDGAFFSMPESDCAMLPIAHATAEEIAMYIWRRLLASFGAQLWRRGVKTMEIAVSEAPGQRATFIHDVPPGGTLDDEAAAAGVVTPEALGLTSVSEATLPSTRCSEFRASPPQAPKETREPQGAGGGGGGLPAAGSVALDGDGTPSPRFAKGKSRIRTLDNSL